jgi:hypothetical protein
MKTHAIAREYFSQVSERTVARFSMQMAGLARYTVASDGLGLAVPRVLSYSTDASSHEVGAEFILMEKALCKTLNDLTQDSLLVPRETGARVAAGCARHRHIDQPRLSRHALILKTLWSRRPLRGISPGLNR